MAPIADGLAEVSELQRLTHLVSIEISISVSITKGKH